MLFFIPPNHSYNWEMMRKWVKVNVFQGRRIKLSRNHHTLTLRQWTAFKVMRAEGVKIHIPEVLLIEYMFKHRNFPHILTLNRNIYLKQYDTHYITRTRYLAPIMFYYHLLIFMHFMQLHNLTSADAGKPSRKNHLKFAKREVIFSLI